MNTLENVLTDWWHATKRWPLELETMVERLQHFGVTAALVTQSPSSRLWRCFWQGNEYYIKSYFPSLKKPWQRWLGQWRLTRECNNLQRFLALGIPVPEIIAVWSKHRLGIPQGGFFLMRAIQDAKSLSALAEEGQWQQKTYTWRRQILAQLAAFTAKWHGSGCVHNDLKWRNILVVDGEPPLVYWIDCPLGRRVFFWRTRARLKDLACLDKVGKKALSRAARLRFYLNYCAKWSLDAADKKRIYQILRYFAGRE